MKIRIQLLLLVSVFALTFVSCKKKNNPDPEPPTTGVTNRSINTWVLDSMRYYYYWNASIPANSDLNLDLSPQAFFETILKRPDDRFSWIQNNDDLRNQLSGVIKTSGLSVAYYLYSGSSTSAYASVRFVHKGSPADLSGIKRGDLFTGVNGSPFAVSNGRVTNASILSGNDPFTLTKGVMENNVISSSGEVRLTPVENFQENAIHMDAVLTTPNGTKVAYLFYNRFLSTSTQLQQMVDAFRKFKSEGATELIIDERYNGGGSIGAAAMLSGLIHKNFRSADAFIRYKWNSRFGESIYTYGQILGTANVNIVAANNLGVDRVFILATGSSASASELLINNLIPFMGTANVIHIGKTTVGKDDASITISNSSSVFDGENDWGIQPIVLKYTNRDGGGGFVNGLVPKYDVGETIPFAPMGSIHDPLVGKALSIIDPSMQAVYGRLMSTNRERAMKLDAKPLEEFNRELTNPRPLDVTESLRRNGLNLH